MAGEALGALAFWTFGFSGRRTCVRSRPDERTENLVIADKMENLHLPRCLRTIPRGVEAD